ncbi:hypothetical protein L195_g043113 [Trifolium pratense]|uniref:Uncharacterized protein n=1 Tax=Trifolium pratense TaxID=57577 RepID=A0A2K3M8E8_TRIPR|nr:hypothetical protein L195_g043113 [Trifolium pratense]
MEEESQQAKSTPGSKILLAGNPALGSSGNHSHGGNFAYSTQSSGGSNVFREKGTHSGSESQSNVRRGA